MARLLGVSIKAIHSYEQGWRKIPHHVERQLLFLLSRIVPQGEANCWEINKCPDAKLSNCPAWEFRSGNLCWFINGTVCSGKVHTCWEEKMQECRNCEVFLSFFKDEKGIIHNE